MTIKTIKGIDPSVATILNAIENEDGPFQRDLITLHPAFLPILGEGRPAPAAELATDRAIDR